MSTQMFPQVGRWLSRLMGRRPESETERSLQRATGEDPPVSANSYRGALSKEPTAEEVKRVDEDLYEGKPRH